MKRSNVVWTLIACCICFGIGWMLPSPVVDAVRSTSGAQQKSEPEPVEIFVDKQTGCQYVGQEKGALTPRLGPDGKQVCNQEPSVLP